MKTFPSYLHDRETGIETDVLVHYEVDIDGDVDVLSVVRASDGLELAWVIPQDEWDRIAEDAAYDADKRRRMRAARREALSEDLWMAQRKGEA